MTLGLDFLSIRKKRPSTLMPSEDLPTFPSPKEIDFELQPSAEDLKEAVDMVDKEPQYHESQPNTPTVDEPVYLKIHAFKNVMAELQKLKVSLDESESKVIKLEENDKSQESAYRSWHDNAKNMHEKLMFIDEMLFKR